jgi:hypothetical protein
LRRLQSDMPGAFDAAQLERLGALQKVAEQMGAEARKQEDFVKAVSGMVAYVRRVRAQLEEDEDPSPSRLDEIEAGLKDLQERVESFEMPIPGEAMSEMHLVLALITERREKRAAPWRGKLKTHLVVIGCSLLMTLWRARTPRCCKRLRRAAGWSRRRKRAGFILWGLPTMKPRSTSPRPRKCPDNSGVRDRAWLLPRCPRRRKAGSLPRHHPWRR